MKHLHEQHKTHRKKNIEKILTENKPLLAITNGSNASLSDPGGGGSHWLLVTLVRNAEDPDANFYCRMTDSLDAARGGAACENIWKQIPAPLRDPEGYSHSGLQNDGWRCGYYCLWWAIQDYFFARQDLELVGVFREQPPVRWVAFVQLLINTDHTLLWIRELDLAAGIVGIFERGDVVNSFNAMIARVEYAQEELYHYNNNPFEGGQIDYDIPVDSDLTLSPEKGPE